MREFSQILHFNSSEVEQHSKHKQRFHFNNYDEVKHRSERSRQSHFNSSERKQHSKCSQKFHFNIIDENSQVSLLGVFILIVVQ